MHKAETTAIAIVCILILAAIPVSSVHATFPGENGKIAFDIFDHVGDKHFEIQSINPDGTGLTNLSNNVLPDLSPNWSPDGTKILFWRAGGELPGLYIMNEDGSEQKFLIEGGGDPAWSPDGSKLALLGTTVIPGTFDENQDIFVINVDGSGKTRLTFDLGEDGSPDWSPDGTKIAFERIGAGANSGMYVMNADGSDQTIIQQNNDGVSGSSPSWSPDGSKIAFTGFDFINLVTDIFVINPDGTEQTRLTDDPHHDGPPVWSPDGSKIAFTRTDAFGSFSDEIFIMNSDGTDQVRITTDGFGKAHPSWQRILTKQTPQQAIEDLKETARSLGISHASLKKASALLSDDNPNNDKSACGKLKAFTNYVKAQTGKKLTQEQANALIESASDIKEQLGC